ncbi:MAG: Tripartite tricarboxylate transporter TctB family [Proteobacteria bacterium]|nr:Tripartite tricarboxylate transporter TctB family [Pseudomonadota bacterium]
MIDRLFGVFLLLLGIYVIYGGLSMVVPFSYDPLGPKTFPVVLGVLLSALSLIIIAKPEGAHFPQSKTMLNTVLIVLLLIVYALSFNFLGFLLATALLVFFMSRIFKGTTKQALGSAIGVSLSVYVLFGVLLDVALPMGTLFSGLLGGAS